MWSKAGLLDSHQLIQTYGYWALLLGTFLEGETILVIAGFAAQREHMSLPWVIVVAAIGTLIGDQLFFFIGRYRGVRFLNAKPSRRERADKALRMIDKYGNWVVLGFRFVYGLRTITPFAIGMSRISIARFAILNFIAASVWATAVGTAGYLFGEALERLIFKFKRYEWMAIAGMACLGVVLWLIHRLWWQQRAKKHDAQRMVQPDESERKPIGP